MGEEDDGGLKMTTMEGREDNDGWEEEEEKRQRKRIKMWRKKKTE